VPEVRDALPLEVIMPKADIECGTCEWEGTEEELGRTLHQVHHLADKLEGMTVVPAGECPKCNCFAFHKKGNG
jgi:hypothetical protein